MKSANIAAEVEFMVCDDSNCLPPSSEELSFKFPNAKKAVPPKNRCCTIMIQQFSEKTVAV